jgi:hypothetical protein
MNSRLARSAAPSGPACRRNRHAELNQAKPNRRLHVAVSNTTSPNGAAARGVVAVDPIRAIIERHRATYARYLDHLGDDDAWEMLALAQWALLHTNPTTLAGMVAWLDYLAEFDNPALFWADDYDGSHDRVNALLGHIRDVLKGMSVAA